MIQTLGLWVKTYWMWIFILSAITLIASIVSVLALIIHLPTDYFSREKHISIVTNPILRLLLRISKNMLGVIALTFGVIMLFTPGQGVLTILAGVVLCNFPGKRKLERKLIQRPLLLSTVNRIRARYNRPPIVLISDVEVRKEEV